MDFLSRFNKAFGGNIDLVQNPFGAVLQPLWDWGVVFRSGMLYRKCSLTFFDKIQGVRLSQSPFDRRWKMNTVEIDTAAAGPADHQIHVSMFESGNGENLFQRTQSQIGSNES